MRQQPGTKVVLSLIDGKTISGRVVRCWRWRTLRLHKGEAWTPEGKIPALGTMLIPYRSIIMLQVDDND
ncbi:hypothetical protein V5R04_15565 [Jonesiaceae bacterium BS-20]|uniref:Uncharacterized protein n=1 Tax=Jonesiaceae bacterium BS-20 TaxID=3120821 RepID=A0AAU7DWL0_9MICO